MMKPRFDPLFVTFGLIAVLGFTSFFGPAARAQRSPCTQAPEADASLLGLSLPAQEDSTAKKPARARTNAPRPRTRATKKAAPEATSRPSRISFAGTAGLQSIYDDNILRASGPTILEFREGISPLKFKIHTYDDLILSPRIGLTFGKRLLGSRETTLRLGYVRFQYVRNGIKNNETWSLRLRQPTLRRDFIEFSYSFSPFAYIRQLSDRAPFDPASSPLIYDEFRSTRTGFSLGYSKRVNDRVTVRMDGGRVMRFYNQRFIENDNWEWNGTGQATVTLTDAFKLAGQYQYSNVTARAIDTVGEIRPSPLDGDPSYERDLYQASLDWSVGGKLPLADLVEVTGQYQGYYYTSKLQSWDDPFHVGRKDVVHALEISTTTVPVYGAATLEAGYRFTQRTSSAAQTVNLEKIDIGEEKDYKDSRIWVGVNYPF
jgi:hypothetical protein